MNIDKRTFLVTLALKDKNNKFIFQTKFQLMKIINKHAILCIEDFKELDSKDLKFKRTSRESVYTYLDDKK